MVNEFLNLFYIMIFVKRRSNIYKYYILYTIHIYIYIHVNGLI